MYWGIAEGGGAASAGVLLLLDLQEPEVLVAKVQWAMQEGLLPYLQIAALASGANIHAKPSSNTLFTYPGYSLLDKQVRK